MKNPRDLPGGPQVSGHARDLPVGGDPARGNAVDGFDHPDGEGLVRHESGSRWYLMLMGHRPDVPKAGRMGPVRAPCTGIGRVPVVFKRLP